MHWRRPLVVDTALALALAALTWGTMGLDEDCPCPVRPLAVVLVLAQTLPLAFRRVAPVPVLLLLGVLTGVHGASTVSDPTVFFGALVALYTAVSLSDRRTSLVLAAVTAVAIGVSVLASGDAPFAAVALNYVVFGTAWILGDSVRTHRAYAAELEDRAASTERRRREDADRAAAEERVRMARELHDVVAHHVSLIAVQSEAAPGAAPRRSGACHRGGRGHRNHRSPGLDRAAPAARRPARGG